MVPVGRLDKCGNTKPTGRMMIILRMHQALVGPSRINRWCDFARSLLGPPTSALAKAPRAFSLAARVSRGTPAPAGFVFLCNSPEHVRVSYKNTKPPPFGGGFAVYPGSWLDDSPDAYVVAVRMSRYEVLVRAVLREADR